MEEKRGGRRPNSGRKTKAEKYQTPIEVAELRCADRLPVTMKNLEKIADGKAEQVEEEWVAAGTVTIGKGAYVKPAFPDMDPEKMVMVKKKRVRFAPDKVANMYLANRVMGTPSAGDDIAVQERVNKFANDFFDKLVPIYGEEKAREIIGHIGADSAGDGGEDGQSEGTAFG